MRFLSEDQCRYVQTALNNQFSKNGTIDASEEGLKPIILGALGITEHREKKNSLFYDCRTPNIGLEFKKRIFKDPLLILGTLIEFTFSRTIDHVPTVDADASIRYIVDRYNAAIDEFNRECSNNTWFAGALCSEDTLVYYHEKIDKLDPSELVGEWRDSKAKNRPSTHNLYVVHKDSGDAVFTYLTKGEKLQVRLRIPTLEHVHVFKAKKTHEYVSVPVFDLGVFEEEHGPLRDYLSKNAGDFEIASL